MSLPVIGITMGDPVGIGPEIIVKALARKEVFACCRPLVFGDPNVLKEANRVLGSPCAVNPMETAGEARGIPRTIDLIELSHIELDDFRFGIPKKPYAAHVIRYLETALSFAMNGRIQGMTTCPINKGALRDAGYPLTGHTELLAQRTNSAPVVMMLVAPGLKVALVTTHWPLRDVPGLITRERERPTRGASSRPLSSPARRPRRRGNMLTNRHNWSMGCCEISLKRRRR